MKTIRNVSQSSCHGKVLSMKQFFIILLMLNNTFEYIKKHLLVFIILLGCLSLNAAPVGLEEARSLGQRFVQSNFELSRQRSNLELVYSQPAFYVFNVGDAGFVIFSSDDTYRPVVGYSDQGVFDPDDMAPALQDFLNRINDYRTSHAANRASQEVVDDWNALRNGGRLVSRYGGREASFLLQTRWNQDYPYNYYCPADTAGPGGHVFAGCVATAAAQVMKYWNHPEHGQGSHTYTPGDIPQYGPITVDFGEATYEWENMPNSISSDSPVAQVEAVAKLIFHVGVSVDMNYRPSSSGASTINLCDAMPEYFFYTDHMEHYFRENYSREQYMSFIVNSIDMSWPMLHRGNSHAYVLDGYDDFGMVHFNWGWSGTNDGWFDIDGHDFAAGESLICNCVPAEVYDATPDAPTNLVVTPAENYALSTMVTWNNPIVSLSNVPLTSIDQIVIMRDFEVVYTENDVTPGAAMTFVDADVPCFGAYDYQVFAIINGQRGKSQKVENVNVGPTCSWKFLMSSNSIHGWDGSYISIQNASGTEVAQVTMTTSMPTVTNMDVPIGPVKMVWVHEYDSLEHTMSIAIKNWDNVSVFSYSGSINGLEGVIFAGNNSCGNNNECGVPSNLTAVQDINDEHVIVLHWDGVEDPGYGYAVLRDDLIVRLVNDGTTEYRDEKASLGGHCYQVAVFCEGGLNGETTNMSCESLGDYGPPRNLECETTSSFNCLLKWEAPVTNEALAGYYLYRKGAQEVEYTRIMVVDASAVTIIDDLSLEEGDYFYKLLAVYEGGDVLSAPAAYKFDPNQYYVHFYYSPTATEETHQGVKLYPNPTGGSLSIEAAALQHVEVFNLLGQKLDEASVKGDKTTIDLKGYGCGVYMVRIQTAESTVTERVFVYY